MSSDELLPSLPSLRRVVPLSAEAQELRSMQLGLALPGQWTAAPREAKAANKASAAKEAAGNKEHKEHKEHKKTAKPEARRASEPSVEQDEIVKVKKPSATAAATAAAPSRATTSSAKDEVEPAPPAALVKAVSTGQLRAKAATTASAMSQSAQQLPRAKWGAPVRPKYAVRTQFQVQIADQRLPLNQRRTIAVDDGWDIVAPTEQAHVLKAQAAPVVSPRTAALADHIIVSVSVPSCQLVKKLKFSPWQTVADAQLTVVAALRRAGTSFPLSDEAASRFRLCDVPSVTADVKWDGAGALPGAPRVLDTKQTLADCGLKSMSHIAFLVPADSKPAERAPAPITTPRRTDSKPAVPAPAPAPAPAPLTTPRPADKAPAPAPAKAKKEKAVAFTAPPLPAADDVPQPAKPPLPPLPAAGDDDDDDSNSSSNIELTSDDDNDDDDDDDDDDDKTPAAEPASDDEPPEGWEKLKDASGRVYYASLSDSKSSWSKPTRAVLPPLRSGWTKHTDPNTGRLFYEHQKSGKTDWSRPGIDEWRALVLNKKLKTVVWLDTPGAATQAWERK